MHCREKVYKVLWDTLGQPLLAAANAAGAAAAPGQPATAVLAAQPPSWREGVISLIHKGKGKGKGKVLRFSFLALFETSW